MRTIHNIPTMLKAALLVLLVIGHSGARAEAGTRLKDITRVKGQESNTLRGLGIVVGLAGTGDGGSFLPTIRSLATAMQLMGNRLGEGGGLELKDAKNVALVVVSVTIPPGGARQGDQLDCTVSSIGAAKSLVGGELFMTPLQGPHVNSDRVFGFAQGAISLDDAKTATRGRVHRGCRLEEDFFNLFTHEGKITLVLDEYHADFEVAQDIAEAINSQLAIQSGDAVLAKALNQVNIEVNIPLQYRDDPVLFVSQVLAIEIDEPRTVARVVINEKTGSVVIGADVEIGPAVVTHRGIVVETGENLPGDRFVPLDPAGREPARLKALIEALKALHVPNSEMIDIIKGLERNGKLHARLIIE